MDRWRESVNTRTAMEDGGTLIIEKTKRKFLR